MVIVYILLFILCLSVLVCVHELGHLTAAKIFKVYCFEFSIGFGPKLFRHKRKNGETYFALRAIPFGGFVSMYGEGDTPEGITVDPSRSLLAIKKWQRAIIMAAGVFMNFVLALVIFFVSESACVQQIVYSNQVTVIPDSLVSKVGIENQDIIYSYDVEGVYYNYGSPYIYVVDDNASITWKESPSDTTKTYSVVFDVRSLNSFNALSLNNFMIVAPNGIDEENRKYPMIGDYVSYDSIESFSFSITTCLKEDGKVKKDEEGLPIPVPHSPITLHVTHSDEGVTTAIESMGLAMYLDSYYNDFPTAVKRTFKDFGNSSKAIFQGLGSLFTDKNAFQNLSGPIGIGVYTTSVLQDLGIGRFLYMWGLISVNLGIINLLPFPGLDGWHLLVVAIEGIFKKEIPTKVKNTVAAVGMLILFALMIMIVIKDIIML